MSWNIHEECGVLGIYDGTMAGDAASESYYGLFALQHRGQESCGIAVSDNGKITGHKGVGLVREIFDEKEIRHLGKGQMAIGHTRYSTFGTINHTNAQPLIVQHMNGMLAIAHNGNLTNALELRRELESSGAIFHTTIDSEIISYMIIRERLHTSSTEEAVSKAMERIEGAYSLVVMSYGKLIGVRDPHGFRPLVIGKRADGQIIFASETCALDALGAEYIRDVEAGEIVVADANGIHSVKDHCSKFNESICVFEYVYFARPDSYIHNMSVQKARVNAGRILAREHPVDADVVIGVPDSGLPAAEGFATESGIPLGTGFIKNKYIARTFIQPTQQERENAVRMKLNVVRNIVKGKRVVMVDDSIVRGTTSGRIVKLLRDAGAAEVHVRLSSPPFISECYYGTDVDSKENLIACKMTVDEICQYIGADTLGYLSVEGVREMAKEAGCGFCTGCFTGNYPAPVPSHSDKSNFEEK